MNRAQALAYLNGRLLAAYSGRTVGALRASSALRLALPHLTPVLALNVAKEVRKDALVIRCAGEALAAGAAPGADAVRRLLEDTKAIDREFLQRAGALPLRIVIDYGRIAPLRVERIQCLLDGAYRILGAWNASGGLRAALRSSYAQADLERLLHRVLHLYALEARALGESVRLPGLLAPLRQHAVARVFEVMAALAQSLARDIARATHDSAQRA